MDLSVGATAGFIGCVCARLFKLGVPIPVSLLIGIGIGALVGLVNGTLAGILPSFIATFATNWVMSGLAIIVMNGAVIYDLPKNFTQLGIGYVGAIPNLVIIAVAIVLILYILLQKEDPNLTLYIYFPQKSSIYVYFPQKSTNNVRFAQKSSIFVDFPIKKLNLLLLRMHTITGFYHQIYCMQYHSSLGWKIEYLVKKHTKWRNVR
jgi:hypothetical protein